MICRACVSRRTKGVIVLELFENEAPDTIGNFVSLVEKDFYKQSQLHRVIKNFMGRAAKQRVTLGRAGYSIYGEASKPGFAIIFRAA